MKAYVGVKFVKAKPMNRQEYVDYRGWELPTNEDGADEGCLIEYVDGGKGNHPDHNGYISWSPKDVFDNAYREMNGLAFSTALIALKAGRKVARIGWNGKGMWLILVPGSPNVVPVANTPYSKAGLVSETNIDAHIDMYTAQGSMQPGWLASQADMLADDWVILE